MDPCILAAELITACAAEGPREINAEGFPAAVTAPATKRFEAAPSASAANPETGLGTKQMAAPVCLWQEAANKPKTGCATPPAPTATGTPELNRPFQTGGSVQTYGPVGPRPGSGDQLFAFRLAALRAGELYTRASPQRYQSQWQGGTRTTYPQWQGLLAREAAVMARSQGRNRLTILVGDSLSLWLPMEQLPRSQFWLNQSISGETTAQILNRLHYFRATQPDQIHIMAGINDLKNGASDAEVVSNTQQILVHLRQQHPQAELVVYSILPTRLGSLPSDRISRVNGYIAYVAHQQGAQFVDLQSPFTDPQGLLRRDLTTDGLHLSRRGYDMWQTALVGI